MSLVLEHIVPIVIMPLSHTWKFHLWHLLRSCVWALRFYEHWHSTKWWQVAHFWQDQKHIITKYQKTEVEEGIDQLRIGTELNTKLETFQVPTKLKTLKKVKMKFCASMFLNWASECKDAKLEWVVVKFSQYYGTESDVLENIHIDYKCLVL